MRVAGFKSLDAEQRVTLGAITILAGANSSGKSSMMQPALLMKQTVDAQYDPGALLLNGQNARFTSPDELLTRGAGRPASRVFSAAFELTGTQIIRSVFSRRGGKGGFEVARMEFGDEDNPKVLEPDLPADELESLVQIEEGRLASQLSSIEPASTWTVVRARCFLRYALARERLGPLLVGPDIADSVGSELRRLIHVPGLRGNPERTYPVTAVGSTFPGTFERYAASVIAQWQSDGFKENVDAIGDDLRVLGLGWKVTAERQTDTQVELKVARLQRGVRGGAHDLVNIADVGLGVSQALPVVVALRVATKGQLVYLEQPEIHLHPRAQASIADLAVIAAERGVRVIIETHSEELLLKLQTLVARDRIEGRQVHLHWFSRDELTGMTNVTSTRVDETGAYGDWPVDFAETGREVTAAYLDEVERHHVSTHARR